MITIFDWFGYEVPYRERYQLIKKVGFDGVLLYWSDEFGNVDYKHNAELARQAGLFVENIHTSFDNINNFWMDNLNGNEITDYLMKCVDDCNEYEIPTILLILTFILKSNNYIIGLLISVFINSVICICISYNSYKKIIKSKI